MARPILGTPASSEILRHDLRSNARSVSHLSDARLEARLREKRSPKYIQDIARLDAGTCLNDPTALHALLDAIAEELPELGIDQRPLGIVSRCFIGPPFEVHRCDLGGSIVEHYECYRAMPPLFERARGLALHGAYALVEIYAGSLRAIAPDGTVAVL